DSTSVSSYSFVLSQSNADIPFFDIDISRSNMLRLFHDATPPPQLLNFVVSALLCDKTREYELTDQESTRLEEFGDFPSPKHIFLPTTEHTSVREILEGQNFLSPFYFFLRYDLNKEDVLLTRVQLKLKKKSETCVISCGVLSPSEISDERKKVVKKFVHSKFKSILVGQAMESAHRSRMIGSEGPAPGDRP
ncbi:MAG: hypothetical protein AAF354_14515, partial [Pseudomonadota bacterium]